MNFFLQFFDNELGREITGLDDQAKSDATRLRVGLKNKRDRGATRKVIMSFEELCDIWPDILGFAYGGSVGEFRLFHVTYVPRLLRRIEAWATERGYDSLAIRVSAVARDYEKAVQNL